MVGRDPNSFGSSFLISGASAQLNRQRARRQRRHAGRQILLLGFLLLVAILGQFALGGWRRRGNVTVLRRRHHAPQRSPVEHQHGWAALQPRITTLALPVAVARLAEGHVAVGVVVAKSCKQAASYPELNVLSLRGGGS